MKQVIINLIQMNKNASSLQHNLVFLIKIK